VIFLVYFEVSVFPAWKALFLFRKLSGVESTFEVFSYFDTGEKTRRSRRAWPDNPAGPVLLIL
jgi:hypothetical protein